MLINLLDTTTKVFDPSAPRNLDATFGKDYFDGERSQGYGGYKYLEGWWEPTCKRAIERYNLTSQSRILDLGCAKGFYLYDMTRLLPGIEVAGLEISEYAISHAPDEIRPFITQGSAHELPYPDDHFDFVSGMNVLHFLTNEECEQSLKEIIRVTKGNASFIQVDAFTNEEEKHRLLSWAGIIKTVYSVDDWLNLFDKLNYQGDYYWSII